MDKYSNAPNKDLLQKLFDLGLYEIEPKDKAPIWSENALTKYSSLQRTVISYALWNEMPNIVRLFKEEIDVLKD